jgi:hypothetical protein
MVYTCGQVILNGTPARQVPFLADVEAEARTWTFDSQTGCIYLNYIADNPLNDGVWLDNRFPGTRVTRNVIVNNGKKGIFLEMSDYDFDTALVDNNSLVDNQLIQFYVHDASGATVMHNLIANSPATSRFGQAAGHRTSILCAQSRMCRSRARIPMVKSRHKP